MGAFLVRVRVRLLLANSMPKPQAWQPLALVFRRSHRLFPLTRSKVGLILLYRFCYYICLTDNRRYTAAVTASPSVGGISSLAQTPLLHQPFVLGPGFSPVPAKLVSQIVAGKFVELHELLSTNLVLNEPEPQLLFDGRLVLTSTPKKPKRRVDDITSWLEAFSIYCLILFSHFPHRRKDLMQYPLLILRTHRQFAGRVWLAYDRAFREHAAASNLTDWSTINVQLFNFHAAGASVRSRGELSEEFSEPRGAPSSLIICKSWNRGHCVAPSTSCRFAHMLCIKPASSFFQRAG